MMGSQTMRTCEIEERGGRRSLRLPREFWFRRDEWDLEIPPGWNVSVCRMHGDDRPVLPEAEIERRISRPTGTAPLKELAAGRKEVAIVVDDMTRPTEASFISRCVLGPLLDAGISPESIRFLVSLGTHGAHDREDFRKKLGEHVVENFRIYNHNCYENCVEVGRTRRGVPLKFNAELMKCDLKIGIGAILPHLYVGYSGGGKILLPGMAHIDTIDRFHSSLLPDQKGRKGDSNPLCGDIEDAVRLTGFDLKVDVLVNTRGQIVDLYAGHPVTVYREGIAAAEEVYRSEFHKEQDVVIANAYLKANEGDIAMLLGFRSLKKKGGTCVLVMSSPTGQMTHYLMRSFGKFIGGRQWVTRSHLPQDAELIVLSEYKDRTSFDSFDGEAGILWMRSWEDVLAHLRAKHQGSVDVCVYPDGTIQYV